MVRRQKSDGSVIIDIEASTDKFESSLLKVGKIGVTALAAVGSAVVGLGTAALKVGKKFETSFAKASTLFGQVDVDISNLKKNILDLSGKTGFAADTLNEALYSALSAGVEVTKDMVSATKFLGTNAKLAKAGFTDVDTAVQSTAKVLNAYKKDVEEIDQVANVLIQTQNKGITTVGELSASLAQVTPTAAAMNVSFEQVGASLAVMTAKGTQTAQATTQLNALFAELGKSGTIGSEGLAQALEGTEYAGKGFAQLMSEGVQLNKVLELINQYAKKNHKSMLDMFSSIEAGKAALSITDASLTFDEDLRAMTSGLGTLDEAYEKVTDTVEEKGQRIVQQLTNMGIVAFEKFQEPLKEALTDVSKNLDELASGSELKEAIDELALAFSSFLKVLSEVAVKALPVVINGLTWVIRNGKLISTLIAGVGGALTAVNLVTFAKKLTPVIDGTAKLMKVTEATTTKMKLMAIAKKTLDFVMQPKVLLLLTGAVAAAGVAYAAFSRNLSDGRKQVDANSKKLKEYTKRIQEVREASREQLQTGLANLAQLDLESTKLKGMVDHNGELKVSKEELVKQLDRYNQVAGETLFTYNNETGSILNQKGEVVNLKNAIDDLLLSKQAQIYLDAHQEEYVEALKLQKETVNDLVATQRQLNELTSKSYDGMSFDEARTSFEELMQTITRDGGLTAETRKQYTALGEFRKALQDYLALSADMSELNQVASGQQMIIDNVNRMNQAVAEGDTGTIKGLLAGVDAATIDAAAGGVDTLKTKIDELLEKKRLLEDSGIKEAYVTNQITALEEQIKTLSDQLAIQAADLAVKATEEGTIIGTNQGEGFGSGFYKASVEGAEETMKEVASTVEGWIIPKKYVDVYERYHRSAETERNRGYGGATFFDLLPFLRSAVPEGATFDESYGGQTINAFNRSYSTSTIMQSKTVQVTQENHFHKEVRKPSDVTREIERTNKELGRAW